MQQIDHKSITTKGIIFALTSALVSGAATVFLRISLNEIPIFLAAALGPFLGATTLFCLAQSKKERINLSAIKEAKRLILHLAFFRGVIGALLFIYGLLLTESIRAVFFTKIEPYFVLLWRFLLFGQRVHRGELVLIVLHFIGAVLVSTSGDFSSLGKTQIGDLLIILSMLVSAYTYLPSRDLSQKIGATATTVSTSLLGSLFLMPLALFMTDFGSMHVSSISIGYFLLYVLCFWVVAILFWFQALKSIEPWIVSALRAVGPLAGVPFAYFLAGENFSSTQALGGILVVITSAMIARYQVLLSRKERYIR